MQYLKGKIFEKSQSACFWILYFVIIIFNEPHPNCLICPNNHK